MNNVEKQMGRMKISFLSNLFIIVGLRLCVLTYLTSSTPLKSQTNADINVIVIHNRLIARFALGLRIISRGYSVESRVA